MVVGDDAEEEEEEGGGGDGGGGGGEGGKISKVRAYPRDGIEEEEEEDGGSKDRVAKREDSVARTDDDAFSYSASSWMSARISGTSGFCLVAVYWWCEGN